MYAPFLPDIALPLTSADKPSCSTMGRKLANGRSLGWLRLTKLQQIERSQRSESKHDGRTCPHVLFLDHKVHPCSKAKITAIIFW